MLQIIVVLLIVGLVLYLLQLVDIDPTIKRVIQAIVIVLVVIWALRFLLPMAGF